MLQTKAHGGSERIYYLTYLFWCTLYRSCLMFLYTLVEYIHILFIMFSLDTPLIVSLHWISLVKRNSQPNAILRTICCLNLILLSRKCNICPFAAQTIRYDARMLKNIFFIEKSFYNMHGRMMREIVFRCARLCDCFQYIVGLYIV